jgi:Ssp1 endopeptidase immunity protein Rap1a
MFHKRGRHVSGFCRIWMCASLRDSDAEWRLSFLASASPPLIGTLSRVDAQYRLVRYVMKQEHSSAGCRKLSGLTALVFGCVLAGVTATATRAADTAALSLKTTEDLYRVCTVPPSDPAYTETADLCEGFLIGAISYHDAIADRRRLKRLVCYPASATRTEGVQAFIAWAAGHQRDQKFMADPAVVGLVRGLAAKWPCH